MKIAVFDLGTNTFNLIIAEIDDSDYKVIINTKESVKLGKGGIHKNVIMPDAIDRALLAFEKLFIHVQQYAPEQIYAIGTSALRTAANASELMNIVKDRYQISIQIISGDKEAELIFLGVQMSLKNEEGPYLILDIGGGSNEFILVENGNLLWKQSFPLGMARLNEMFKFSDPIINPEISALEKYFDEILTPLFEIVKNYKIKYLVGAEGAFETFYRCIQDKNGLHGSKDAQIIEKEKFLEFHKMLVKTTLDERMQISEIESYRLEMVVPATIFINYILKKLNIGNILVSANSLKEGIIKELINKKASQV